MAFTLRPSLIHAPKDYAPYLWDSGEGYGIAQKTDRYRDATLLNFSLAVVDPSFPTFKRGTYITFDSVKYPKWFTGYITNSPELVYLGTKGGVPTWGYTYQATSDEYILSLKPLGIIPTFYNCSMGFIIKSLVNTLLPNTFDVSNVADGPLVAQYVIDPTKLFSDVTKDLTQSAAFTFYGNGLKLYFTQQDQMLGGFTIDKKDPNFTPEALTLFKADEAALINDATVLGEVEAENYVTEYFAGTGLTSAFPLSASVYGTDNTVFIDEDFSGSSISSTWNVFDLPAEYLQVSQGYLNSLGGPNDGSFSVYLASGNSIPMEGRLRMTHGEWDFVPASGSCGNGIICGSWTQAPNAAYIGLLYGLKCDGVSLKPIVGGILDTTQSITLDFTKRYVIRTLVEFTKTNRSSQTYNYIDGTGTVQSASSTGQPDNSTWVTLITEVDPDGGTVANQFTLHNVITRQVTFTNALALTGVSDCFATYAPIVSDSLTATVTGITISIPLNATLETATICPFANTDFDSWDSFNQPSGWAIVSGTPKKEDSIVNGGSSLKMDNPVVLQQDASQIIQPNTQYTFTCRAKGVGSGTQSLRIYLYSVIASYAEGLVTSAISTTEFSFLTAVNSPVLTTIPTDLKLRVELSGGSGGDKIYVDDINIVSNWTRELVGPNEIDSIDGLAPVATVVSANNGTNSFNSVTHASQYNPGQSVLTFFSDSVTRTTALPAANQIIRFSYRAAQPSVGRAIDKDSILLEASEWLDNGVRSVVRSDLSPRPRTSAECELAAAAIVNENSYVHYDGQYVQFSEYFQVNLPTFTISNAAPAVIGAIAHGASTGYIVTIAGGTGLWANSNGTYPCIYIDANNVSIPTSTVGLGAPNVGLTVQISGHNEPKSGCIVKFSNFTDILDLVPSEVSEVLTTVESGQQPLAWDAATSYIPGAKVTYLGVTYKALLANSSVTPTPGSTWASFGPDFERFSHQITFGKPDHVNDFVERFGNPPGTFQRQDESSQPITPVDVATAGSALYANDVTLPTLLGWDSKFLWFNANQTIGSHFIDYELRTTDTSWGVDDGKNLIARPISNTFNVPRLLRGGKFYIKEVDTGNLIHWSEDPSQGTWSPSGVSIVMGSFPDYMGGTSRLAKCTFSAGGSLSTNFTVSSTSFTAFTFDAKGPAGTAISVVIAGHAPTVFTLTGYWQRITAKLPSVALSGSNTVSITASTSGIIYLNRLSVERDTLSETTYTKTTSILYGPASRYATLVNVSFPFTELGQYQTAGFIINNSTTGTDIAPHKKVHVPGALLYINAVVKKYPTTGTVVIDVWKNGTSLFLAGGSLLQIPQPNLAWSNVTAYSAGTTVNYQNKQYTAILPNTNVIPPSDVTNWSLIGPQDVYSQTLFATYPYNFVNGDVLTCNINTSDGTALFNVEVKWQQTGN